MERQLFAIAGVDALGKHTFFTHCPFLKDTIQTHPSKAVRIGTKDDINRIIQKYRTELSYGSSVDFIPYTVKSNITELEFYNETNELKGTYTIH